MRRHLKLNVMLKYFQAILFSYLLDENPVLLKLVARHSITVDGFHIIGPKEHLWQDDGIELPDYIL